MAAVTTLGSTFTTTAGAKTVTATPAAGSLIVACVANSDRTMAQAPTVTDDQSGTYTQVLAMTNSTNVDSGWAFVRDALVPSGISTIFTMTPVATDTGGGFGGVLQVTGMTKVGTAAIRQSQKADNQATGTPSVTLGAAILTTNAAIGYVLTNQTGTTNTAPPTGWTELQDSGYNTPATGREICHIDSGSTLTTVAWTAATTSAFCAMVLELDTSAGSNPGAWWGGGGISGVWLRQGG